MSYLASLSEQSDHKDATELAMSDLSSLNSFAAIASCPQCEAAGEFDLPMADGQFDIACHNCGEVYAIDAAQAIEKAAQQDELSSDEVATEAANDDNELVAIIKETVTCMECGQQFDSDNQASPEEISCPHCAKAADDGGVAGEISHPANRYPAPISKKGRTSIILVSIISLALVASASLVTLGLYFLTLSDDRDTARYIETNILQVKPASFTVDSAAYEISQSELGKSLLVTIQITNAGGVEGTPNSMQVVLTDANDKALVSWPLDVTGQIITAGQTVQLYTRLFEPPENFKNLKVYLR